ncbi:MAG: N-acetyltransferase family protein [Terriglobales bacterium]|jgi:L-amino acid N-acyltransferase YncA
MRVSNFDIRAVRNEDWPAVQKIYSEGIATGNATFETETPPWEKWDQGHLQDCRLVAVNSEGILGWAALSPVSTRRVYSGVAEVSVYVAAKARGQGVGTLLLQSLVEQSEHCGVWTLQAGIFPENVPSVALHKSCGFREVGLRQKLGQRRDVWRDVLLLERRSSRVGV